MFNDSLFIIPARGGSKGIPFKNIKQFLGKPLIHYSIEYARLFVPDNNICVTTDNLDIAECVEQIGLKIPFIRPIDLATDTADTFSVLKHAYSFYINQLGRSFSTIILLQPTSPLREKTHLEEAISLFKPDIEMVVSVCKSKSNPYLTIFEENQFGFLELCKGNGTFTRRQDAPSTYEYNGSIYIICNKALEVKASFNQITKKIKYIMDDYYAVDIDTIDDWNYAEYKYSKK